VRTAFISDIHANLDALDTVLADIQDRDVDRIVCLGDIVGYGPEPNECVGRVREVAQVTVVGNHDYAALGLLDTLAFNEYARAAADWTSDHISEAARDFLLMLPLTVELDGMRLVHASPLEPADWTYVLSFHEAERQFEAFEEKLCFIGHSHLPVVIEQGENGLEALQFPSDGSGLSLDPDRRYIVNVGSVGQPRDRDPRAGYCIYDDAVHEVSLHRLDYAVPAVQEKVVAAGLPPFLAMRLAAGM